MKLIVAMLVTLLGLLQYELWFASGGLYGAHRLQQNIAEKRAINIELIRRNEILAANVEDLKQGKEALEEHARQDLGMVKKGEIFYQIVRVH